MFGSALIHRRSPSRYPIGSVATENFPHDVTLIAKAGAGVRCVVIRTGRRQVTRRTAAAIDSHVEGRGIAGQKAADVVGSGLEFILAYSTVCEVVEADARCIRIVERPHDGGMGWCSGKRSADGGGGKFFLHGA